MDRLVRQHGRSDRPTSAQWRRWAGRYALPSAAVALGSVWLYQPHSVALALAAAAVALTALITFVATMPTARRRPQAAGEVGDRDAEVTSTDDDSGADNGTDHP